MYLMEVSYLLVSYLVRTNHGLYTCLKDVKNFSFVEC